MTLEERKMDDSLEELKNADRECEAVPDFCWNDDEGGEQWWTECSLCGRRMDVIPPSRCPSCGATVARVTFR